MEKFIVGLLALVSILAGIGLAHVLMLVSGG